MGDMKEIRNIYPGSLFISSNVVIMVICVTPGATSTTITMLQHNPSNDFCMLDYTLTLNNASDDNWWNIHHVL